MSRFPALFGCLLLASGCAPSASSGGGARPAPAPTCPPVPACDAGAEPVATPTAAPPAASAKQAPPSKPVRRDLPEARQLADAFEAAHPNGPPPDSPPGGGRDARHGISEIAIERTACF